MLSAKKDKLVYFLCSCGTIYHRDVEEEFYTAQDLGELRSQKFFEEKLRLFQRTYLPVIEENLYGRESLEVGFGFTESLIEMRKRGWIADGIDTIPNDYITGDFMTHDFKGKQYDLVIFNHSLQCFDKPRQAMAKAVSLLRAGGMLLVASPDTASCLEVGYQDFGYWGRSNRVMMCLTRTIFELSKLGMEPLPLIAMTNFNKRYLYHNDFHLIMRKGLSDGK